MSVQKETNICVGLRKAKLHVFSNNPYMQFVIVQQLHVYFDNSGMPSRTVCIHDICEHTPVQV